MYCRENTNTCFSEKEAMVLQAGSLLSRAYTVDRPFIYHVTLLASCRRAQVPSDCERTLQQY